MSQALKANYSIRNREGWKLSTVNEEENISSPLSNSWDLPYNGDTLFIWENCSELPSSSLLNNTIQTLSQKNCRSGFQVYKGEDNLMYVVFGKPGLAGGGKPGELTERENLSIAAGGLAIFAGLFVIAFTNNELENNFTKFLGPNQRSISTLPIAIVSGGLLQGGLYICKTPKKEFSMKELCFATLRGGSTGFTTEIFSMLMENMLVSPNAEVTKHIKNVFMAAIAHGVSRISMAELPSLRNMGVAALSSGVTSGISAGFDGLVSSETMNRFIVNEGAKGGVNGALSTLISNLFSRGQYGEVKKLNDDLLLAAAGGALLGAAGAALQGKLPHERREKERELEPEEQKLLSIKADCGEKQRAYSDAERAYSTAKEGVKKLKDDIGPKEQAAIDAHTRFVATGRKSDEERWKAAQTAVRNAQDLYKKEDRYSWSDENPIYVNYEKTRKAYWDASDILDDQKKKVASLREIALQHERVLTLSHDMINSIPSHLHAVDPLEERIQKLEPRIKEIDRQLMRLRDRHLSTSKRLIRDKKEKEQREITSYKTVLSERLRALEANNLS